MPMTPPDAPCDHLGLKGVGGTRSKGYPRVQRDLAHAPCDHLGFGSFLEILLGIERRFDFVEYLLELAVFSSAHIFHPFPQQPWTLGQKKKNRPRKVGFTIDSPLPK